MKCLITGIAGFIGFHTAKRLAAAGHEVVGLDNINAYYSPELKRARLAQLPSSVAFHKMDIAENSKVMDLFQAEQPDVVIHLAAQAGVRHSLDQPFDYAHSNLLGHLSILEACRHLKNLSHLVYASSSSVYGGNTQTPFRESDKVDAPVSLYAATKRADELMSSTYAHLYGVNQIGLRFFTVYGEWGRPDMAYWIFTQKILRGDPIKVFNHGDMRRDFTYIDDIVTGVVACAEKPPQNEPSQRPHTVYNIGNNQPEQLMTLITTLETLLGKPAIKQFEPMQPGDVHETYADIDRFQADYGFAPTTALEVGLANFVSWYKEMHALTDAV